MRSTVFVYFLISFQQKCHFCGFSKRFFLHFQKVSYNSWQNFCGDDSKHPSHIPPFRGLDHFTRLPPFAKNLDMPLNYDT